MRLHGSCINDKLNIPQQAVCRCRFSGPADFYGLVDFLPVLLILPALLIFPALLILPILPDLQALAIGSSGLSPGMPARAALGQGSL